MTDRNDSHPPGNGPAGGVPGGIGGAVGFWSARAYSAAVRKLASTKLPKALRGPVIRGFASTVGASLGEAEKSATDYESIMDFFGRALTGGSRPFESNQNAVLSPCDGRVMCTGPISDTGDIAQVKGAQYSLSQLIASEAPEHVRPLHGGDSIVIYLSPRDYHRVHVPFDCTIRQIRYVPGALWPVTPFFVQKVHGLFARNERVVFDLYRGHGTSQEFLGCVVMVSAIGVGNVKLAPQFGGLAFSRHQPGMFEVNEQFAAGDELGTFLLGSTVALVTRRGFCKFTASEGEPVQMGQLLAQQAERGSR